MGMFWVIYSLLVQRKECKISMKVAVLAVQGAFEEHEKVLQELGAQTIQLRQAKDLEDSFDALVLPGGESTVQGKLLRELDMYEPLRAKIAAGLPVLATCAGLILLAEHIAGDDTVLWNITGDGEEKCIWKTAWKLSLCGRRICRDRNLSDGIYSCTICGEC